MLSEDGGLDIERRLDLGSTLGLEMRPGKEGRKVRVREGERERERGSDLRSTIRLQRNLSSRHMLNHSSLTKLKYTHFVSDITHTCT